MMQKLTQRYAILLEDVISGNKKKCYGLKNDPLIITYKKTDTVWLVKNPKNGEVFPVSPQQVKEIP